MGKKAKRRQRAAMNEMNEMVQGQVDYFQEQQQKAQNIADQTRAEFDAFEFSNPMAGIQNPYANITTDFGSVAAGMTNYAADAGNVYAGAQNVYADAQNTFENMENMYEGMENRFEDMTVDMRAADFQAQQGQQQRANILQGLRGAAGSSGVAGLAQAMANQGAMQSQQIAAGIGQQERQNQMLAAQEGSRIDQMQRGASMQLQQQTRAGRMQTQAMRLGGASEQQRMILGGASEQQQLAMRGAAQLQSVQFQGATQAQQLSAQAEQLQAKGGFMADMAEREGEAALQAANYGKLSTGLGMDYGLLAGANTAYQGSLANQMSAMGMEVEAHGSQAQGSMSLFGDLAKTAAVKYAFMCVPKGVKIDSIDKTITIEDIKPGDIVIGYSGEPVKVLQKHEYLEDPTKERFYKVKFDNGSIVNVCDMHEIKGVAAKDITEDVVSKETHSGVEFSYDLLTEDLGYRIGDIPVNSMIPKMATAIAEKIKNK